MKAKALGDETFKAYRKFDCQRLEQRVHALQERSDRQFDAGKINSAWYWHDRAADAASRLATRKAKIEVAA